MLVRWNNHNMMLAVYIQNWWLNLYVVSCSPVASLYVFLLFALEHREWKAPYGQCSQFSTSQKPSTIQNGRTFFKPLTHVSMWCDVNGWLSDVEKVNALTTELHHSSASSKAPVNSFIWVELYCCWSLFLVYIWAR